ncbi:HalOD1 output domain-containing protein [Natrinema sp. SYSU A 869]|uniref:HalOD1 output domain-containing protein n=1 Tax=Natrinema sp. SYSU A 869 TaxID=2871694 RepID=UPI001CA3E85D|nr:HalOD1 output domain-containing protein [Natrinema sp. SYSU A 869]
MSEPSDSADETVVLRRQLNTEEGDTTIQLVEIIAELDDREPTELSPLYRSVDSLISDLFGSPPPTHVDANLVFSYHGYRVHVQQDGMTTFRELSG